MAKKKFDSAEVKFTIVPHGYQCDFEIHAKSGGRPMTGSICRDFGDDVGFGAVCYLLGLADGKAAFEKLAAKDMPKKPETKGVKERDKTRRPPRPKSGQRKTGPGRARR
jgi:hypothetical protein